MSTFPGTISSYRTDTTKSSKEKIVLKARNKSAFKRVKQRRSSGKLPIKQPPANIQVTYFVDEGTPRVQSPEMRTAVIDKVRDLLKCGTFKVIFDEEFLDRANVLNARFVLGIKSNAEGKIEFKASYVIAVHLDKLKLYMVHSAQTLQASSPRHFLTIASNFRSWKLAHHIPIIAQFVCA